jgi:hypothetical protein
MVENPNPVTLAEEIKVVDVLFAVADMNRAEKAYLALVGGSDFLKIHCVPPATIGRQKALPYR